MQITVMHAVTQKPRKREGWDCVGGRKNENDGQILTPGEGRIIELGSVSKYHDKEDRGKYRSPLEGC